MARLAQARRAESSTYLDGLLIDFTKGFGAFPERPTPSQIAAIQEHIVRTGTPETHPALCLAQLSPDVPQEGHHIIGHIDLLRTQRRQESLIWCAVCGGPKFLHGRLVWSETEQAIRVVGADCASNHFAHWGEMQAAYTRKEMAERAIANLLEKLPTLPRLISELTALMPLAVSLRQLHKDFFSGAPQLAAQLEAASRLQQGMLQIERWVLDADYAPGRTRLGPERMRPVRDTVSRIRGQPFVAASFAPARELSQALVPLNALVVAGGEQGVLELLSAMSQEHLIQHNTLLLKALQQAEKAKRKIDEGSGFLSMNAFAEIEQWLNHPECPCQTSITRSRDGVTFREHGGLNVRLPTLVRLKQELGQRPQ